MTEIAPNDHTAYMAHALALAHKSPPKSTNYAVGAVLVDPSTNTILSTGYTLELPGNTHAEQCCFLKLLQKNNLSRESDLADVLPRGLALYTTMEPCSKRLSGAVPCAERILEVGRGVIGTVFVGILEPGIFVERNVGRGMLEREGVRFVHVEGMEEEILRVAKAGHVEKR